MNKRVLKATLVFFIAACTFGSLLIVKTSKPVSQRLVRITANYRTRVLSHGAAFGLPDLNAVETPRPIPKILHNVYLDGLDNLELAESAVGALPGQRFPGYNSSWRQSCQQVHRGWKYMFWDNARAETLIQKAYPWFLATFQSYRNNVQKGEVQ